MSIIGSIRNRKLQAEVLDRAALYDQRMSPEDRMGWQLELINRCWPAMFERIPHYQKLVATGKCPRSFSNLEEFSNVTPPTTKRMVQMQMSQISDPSRPADALLTTGGSTGEPTTIPVWNEERLQSMPDRWLGRHWFGIRAGDRLFMIWGHSHLLGTGFKGWWRAGLRVVKDAALGYYRFSAYQLDEKRLKEAAEIMLRFRPRYVLGYSSALDYFARVNRDRVADFTGLELKGAFGTGEVFPFEDGPILVSKGLQCPVGMEYGSIETGVMGYSVPHPGGIGSGVGEFRLFWRSYLFEAGEPGTNGGRVLRITSLFPRKFPLVRYETGDEVLPSDDENPLSLTRLSRVFGKSLSFVTMDDGTVVNSFAFEHSVRACPGVQRFQLVDTEAKPILKIVAPGVDQAATAAMVRDTLRKIHPSLVRADIDFTDTLLQTRAGKTPIVIHLKDHKPLA